MNNLFLLLLLPLLVVALDGPVQLETADGRAAAQAHSRAALDAIATADDDDAVGVARGGLYWHDVDGRRKRTLYESQAEIDCHLVCNCKIRTTRKIFAHLFFLKKNNKYYHYFS